ncbi:hypothetical protein FF1_036567 [Malus domestica]
MAKELTLDLEELRHLQSMAKRHRIINHLNLLSKHLISEITTSEKEPLSLPPPQSSQPKGKEMKSTVRPQNAAKREAAEQEKTNHKPNPNKHRYGFSASMKIAHYIKEYGGLLNKGELRENITVSLDGQILNKMSSSDSKRFFYDLQGGSSKVQIVADPRNLKMDEFEFSKFYSCISPGDFIGVTGFPGKTNRGDLSIFPRSFIALSNSHPVSPSQKAAAPYMKEVSQFGRALA